MGLISFFTFLAIALTLVYYFLKQKLNYWKKLGVPYEEPTPPYGNLQGIGKKAHISKILAELYQRMKSAGSPFCGIYFFFSPVVLATSMDFIKAVLVKDSAYFINRGNYYNEDDDPLSAHLFNIDNPKWRPLRMKLTPTFTSGKMKMMFQTVCDVGDRFVKTVGAESDKQANNIIEIKDLAARFTTDVIGSCAFGLECNSLENPKNEFRIKAKRLFEDPKHSAAFVNFALMFKKIAQKLHVTLLRKELTDFFLKIVSETVEYRENNLVNRNDFMHLLIELKNKGDEYEKLEDKSSAQNEGLTITEVASQALIFFVAGFETSSTAMTYTLFEMSQNPEVQDKARENVTKVLEKHGGVFSYDAVADMTYIDNCISESLRKYPPVTNLTRECVQDYHVEGTDVVIKKGQMVFIPAFAIQNDPDIYPNPSVFNPDRFTQEEKSKRSAYSFLSFGQGPRNCVGLRFGMMQAKIGLALLLKNYKFEHCEKTVSPIKFAPGLFILTPNHGVYLKVTKI